MSKDKNAFPKSQDFEKAIRQYRAHRKKIRFLKAFICMLIIALAAGLYVNASHFTLLQVEGNSMRKTLENGDVVLCHNTKEVQRGDIIAFNLDGVLLIKRVIGVEGDRISIMADGTVLLNGQRLDESYVYGKSLGNSDLVYPITVGAGEFFCMGDHRSTSIDSRTGSFGNVMKDSIVGTIEAVVWPFYRIGFSR